MTDKTSERTSRPGAQPGPDIESEAVPRAGESWYRYVCEQTGQIAYEWDVSTGAIQWAGAIEQVTGYNAREFNGIDFEAWLRMLHTADRPRIVQILDEAAEAGSAFSLQYRLVRKDGSFTYIEDTGVFVRDEMGRPSLGLGTMRDVTARRQAEDALRESERRAQALFDQTFQLMALLDVDGTLRRVNATALALAGIQEADVVGLPFWDTPWWTHDPAQQEKLKGAIRAAAEGECVRFPVTHRDRAGRLLELDFSIKPFRDEDRAIRYLIPESRDVSELKRTEEALRLAQFSIDKAADQILWATDNASLVYANEAACTSLGYTQEELLSMTVHDIDPDVPPAKWLDYLSLFREKGSLVFETRHRKKDGSIFPVEIRTTHIYFHDKEYLFAFCRDITERKVAEAEKARLEEQLLQAQKMESIGRLAGGIAHDFNNLLTGISGNILLAMLDLNPEGSIYAALSDAVEAAKSATALTRQLLAFSRKQIIEPKVVDLNELIERLHVMLARLIGEDIHLQKMLADGLWKIKADPGQIEQLLVNLAVNARDAMPRGGRLVIKTKNMTLDKEYCQTHAHAAPGDYVMISVSDTGCGMSSEVKRHLFEPFFTTKAKGKGTGLGLATVYGVIQQNRGIVEVYSKEGVGTSFKVFLPRVFEEASERPAPETRQDLAGGRETILLVEDETTVRSLTCRVLQRLGYKVYPCANGEEALEVAAGHKGKIDLLMTDVVMPSMNGRALAVQLTQQRPDVKVLFTSGYTEDIIADHGVIEEGLHFIGKPYAPEDLARKIRSVLDHDGQGYEDKDLAHQTSESAERE